MRRRGKRKREEEGERGKREKKKGGEKVRMGMRGAIF